MYSFRKALNSDEAILLEWINDSLTREMSLDGNKVSSEEHKVCLFRLNVKNTYVSHLMEFEIFQNIDILAQVKV